MGSSGVGGAHGGHYRSGGNGASNGLRGGVAEEGADEINFYGPLLLTRAFVPVLEANGGGHVLTVHSVLVLADDITRWVKGAPTGDVASLHSQLAP